MMCINAIPLGPCCFAEHDSTHDVSSCASSEFVAKTSGLMSSAATCLLNSKKSFEF